jgi:hypothetical protein
VTWQPIETAPKDGTWILAFSRTGSIPYVAQWKDDGWRNNHYGDREPYWRFSVLDVWMPLPEPPDRSAAA